jgi:hypothetical protein
MKRKSSITSFIFAAALLVETFGSPLASAKGRPNHSDVHVVGQIGLPGSPTTALFLRMNAVGQTLLYVVQGDHSISVLDVTKPEEPKEVDELRLNEGSPQVHLRAVGPDAVLTTASDPAQPATGNGTACPEIAKQFSHADVYTIDGGRSLVYIAEKGKLSILKFDRPLTREAEIWEESYESR